MKKISFFTILGCILIFSAGIAFGSNVEFKAIEASEGVKVKLVKLTIEFPPEKIVPLYVLPKELRDIALAKGEGQEFNFQIFSPEETTVNVKVLENGEPTDMVMVLTPRVGIMKDNYLTGVVKIIIIQPEKAKRKNHLTLQFISEDEVLATAEVFVRLPLADKYCAVDINRGKNNSDTEDNGNPYYSQLSLSVGVRTRSTDTSVGWRKNLEDLKDEGEWFLGFNYWFH